MMSLKLLILIFLGALGFAASAEKILLIGDSHSCGPFGFRLSADLSNNGQNDVTVFCAGASNAAQWLKGVVPKIPKGECYTWRLMTSAGAAAKLRSSAANFSPQKIMCAEKGKIPAVRDLLKIKYDRVVVAHGTNSLDKATVGPEFFGIAQLILSSGAKCDWIGPPSLGKHPYCIKPTKYMPPGTSMRGNLGPFVESLKTKLPCECRYIDSRFLTPEPPANKDCIHRWGHAANEWADAVWSKMTSTRLWRGAERCGK